MSENWEKKLHETEEMGGYLQKYQGGNSALDDVLKQEGKNYRSARERVMNGDRNAIMDMVNANDRANQARNAAGYAAELAVDDINYVKSLFDTSDLPSAASQSNAGTPDYMKPFTTPDKPQYEPGEWDQKSEELTRQALGMNYDSWTQGEDYAALKQRYSQQGQMAMDDTLGKVSARTGGLASSYAGAAAQQQYNAYMAQLEDVARQMYSAQRGELTQNAQLARGLAERDYGRYRDDLSQWNSDRAFNYNAAQDQRAWEHQLDREGISDARYADETGYARGRDQLSDERYADETGYARGRDAVNDAWRQTQWDHTLDREAKSDAAAQLQAMIDSGMGAWELPQDAVRAANMAPGYWEAQERTRRDAQTAKTGTGGSSSSSSGSKMTLSTAQNMANQRQFTQQVIDTLRNAGYTDEYIKSVYKWTGHITGTAITDPSELGPAAMLIYKKWQAISPSTTRNVKADFEKLVRDGYTDGSISEDEGKYILSLFGYNG